eukprot:Sspe_Gene.37324::Locus_18018_Transcript_1_1_Confidence_1.000_Length_3460::g.37324::m.37324
MPCRAASSSFSNSAALSSCTSTFPRSAATSLSRALRCASLISPSASSSFWASASFLWSFPTSLSFSLSAACVSFHLRVTSSTSSRASRVACCSRVSCCSTLAASSFAMSASPFAASTSRPFAAASCLAFATSWCISSSSLAWASSASEPRVLLPSSSSCARLHRFPSSRTSLCWSSRCASSLFRSSRSWRRSLISLASPSSFAFTSSSSRSTSRCSFATVRCSSSCFALISRSSSRAACNASPRPLTSCDCVSLSSDILRCKRETSSCRATFWSFSESRLCCSALWAFFASSSCATSSLASSFPFSGSGAWRGSPQPMQWSSEASFSTKHPWHSHISPSLSATIPGGRAFPHIPHCACLASMSSMQSSHSHVTITPAITMVSSVGHSHHPTTVASQCPHPNEVQRLL